MSEFCKTKLIKNFYEISTYSFILLIIETNEFIFSLLFIIPNIYWINYSTNFSGIFIAS